ncbi:MAG: response regulator [candidate division Zixibacteria bacterium]|nr:response regulator [candidate division Zixibacteria bacterium]
MKILVIDDEEMIRNLACKILQRDGHEVLLADSGQGGLAIVSREHESLGLVLVDVNMQGMSGIETLRRIREISPMMPCIISSGQISDQNDLPDDLTEHLRFLQKPYRANTLSEMVRSFAAERQPSTA